MEAPAKTESGGSCATAKPSFAASTGYFDAMRSGKHVNEADILALGGGDLWNPPLVGARHRRARAPSLLHPTTHSASRKVTGAYALLLGETTLGTCLDLD